MLELILRTAQCGVAHLDADQADNKALAGKYGVSGFPTLKVRDDDPRAPSKDLAD